jgi:hypothetical protein
MLPPATPDDSSSLFSDLVSVARKKARDREDSVKAAQKPTVRLTQAEEVRQANMRLLQEGAKKRNEQMKKENQDKANKQMVEIYTMLEKKDYKKAYEQYTDRQAFLARYIPAPAFTALDSLVNVRYAAAVKKKHL